MRDRQGSRHWGPAAAIVLLPMLPLFYVLSLGPVSFIYHTLGEPRWMECLEAFYEPLDYLPEPVQEVIWRYRDLWPG